MLRLFISPALAGSNQKIEKQRQSKWIPSNPPSSVVSDAGMTDKTAPPRSDLGQARGPVPTDFPLGKQAIRIFSAPPHPEPGQRAHFPAFAVIARSPGCGRIRCEEEVLMRSGKAGKRDAHRDGETMERPEYRMKTPRFEFLKNCINSDKFTMFFDKFLKIYMFDFVGVAMFQAEMEAVPPM